MYGATRWTVLFHFYKGGSFYGLCTCTKDLTKVKTKVAFNLTKRQLVCFGGGALLGVPLFFLLRGSAGNSTAALGMMFVMLPFFLLAM